ncbi:uncharacterized protein LOC132058094 [Lycium ferocissimum]|uniref:uncharacterized protein LOC132058094 n=1 Tax=Lycium ferocissimum TaxID=112874 RepID=UPI0028169558|nr:uncharacterized protein LOC132058094 [Lycium ferocissimum]
MSRFYTFMWNRMNTSERKVVEELHDRPSVFVPSKFGASLEDAVPGVLLSLKEVFWCDSTGSVDQVKMVSTILFKIQSNTLLPEYYVACIRAFMTILLIDVEWMSSLISMDTFKYCCICLLLLYLHKKLRKFSIYFSSGQMS